MNPIQLSSLTEGSQRLILVLPHAVGAAWQAIGMAFSWHDRFARIEIVAPSHLYSLAASLPWRDGVEVLKLTDDERLRFSDGIFCNCNAGATARKLQLRSSGCISAGCKKRDQLWFPQATGPALLEAFGRILQLPTPASRPKISIPERVMDRAIATIPKPGTGVIMDLQNRFLHPLGPYLTQTIRRTTGEKLFWTSAGKLRSGEKDARGFYVDTQAMLALASRALLTITRREDTALFLQDAGARVLLVTARPKHPLLPSMKPHDLFELKRHLHGAMNEVREMGKR